MIERFYSRAFYKLLLGLFLCTTSPALCDLWVSAYYAGYHQDDLPPSEIDFTATTHVIHFAVIPRSDGTLDQTTNVLPPENCSNLVYHAHKAGKQALISVGGAGSAPLFRAATASPNLAVFIMNLTNFVSRYDYDGIDIDWEEFRPSDTNQFSNLIRALRQALNGFSDNKLLTVAALPYPRLADPPMFIFTTLAVLQSDIDQINFMTYRLSGAFQGWVTWFTAPLFDGNFRFPNTSRLVPSTDAVIISAISNGIVPQKIGVGIYCSGDVWIGGSGTSTGGASQPRQSWDDVNRPTVTNIAYHLLMDSYFQSHRYRWDDSAQAPYLTFDGSGTNDLFVSYEDERSCETKVSYARNSHLGGVMLFELGNGYRSSLPPGARHPLLQAIKQSIATPRWTDIQRNGDGVALSFRSLPLALYRIQYATKSRPFHWTTLTNNVSGNGEIMRVFDNTPIADQTFRVYRIQTPP